jgi:hypothetical protein
MGLPGLLPYLAGGRGLLARPLGLPFGLFYAPAGALELFFGDPYALPCDFRLQTRPLQRLRRFPLRGHARPGSVGAVARGG